MAIVTIEAGMPDQKYWADFLQPAGSAAVIFRDAGGFEFANPDNSRVNAVGDGYTFDAGGIPISGTIHQLIASDASFNPLFEISGLNVSLVDYYFQTFGFSDGFGGGRSPSGYDAMTIMLRGDDQINGSEEDDRIAAGLNEGNDIIDAKGGNDFVTGDVGNDTINGGDGNFDVLSYRETFYQPSAFQGINLDAAAGTVTDSWGGTDTISGFEDYMGSRFDDVMNGSDSVEFMTGLRGADTFDGRGEADVVYYLRDREYGGMHGINANLGTGQISDGWGCIDTVFNIENVVGTMFDDGFVGDGGDNFFMGLAGHDAFDGGGGLHDEINFDINTDFGANVGIIVDLSLAGDQIVNDGFGNSENAFSIENVKGSNLADRIRGNGVANVLSGNGGNDILIGAGGTDTLDGGDGRDTADYSEKTAAVVVTLDGSNAVAVNVGGVDEDTIRNIENIVGGSAGDTLTGDGAANTLNGGGGADTMAGFAGSDIYVVDNSGDIADESLPGSDGTDLVRSAITFSLGDAIHAKGSIENLTLIGSAAINGTGTSGANALTGNAASNVLNGGADSDVLTGGLGRDTLRGGPDADRFDFNAIVETRPGAALRDTIADFSHVQHDKIDLATIDANTGNSGNQAFVFIGADTFAHYHALHPSIIGMVRFAAGVLQGNVNGNLATDFEIAVPHVTSLATTDFFL